MLCRKVFSALFLTLLSAVIASAQENRCSVRLADLPASPELRGFRLGMTHDQVKARVPQVVFGPTDELGVSKVSINPDFDPRIDKSTFADVRTVSLDFLDGHVTALWIGYEDTFKWKTIDEFVKGISQALRVPDQWRAKGRGQQLRCSDFELSVSTIAGGPSLRIDDLPAAETLATRRQAKEDAAEAAAQQVIGDTRNKIYYQPDCEALKTVPEKSRISFGNKEEAEKAGYQRAENCG